MTPSQRKFSNAMSNPPVTTTAYRRPHLLIAGTVIVFLIPLFSIPGPSMVTGHPWKVELAVSVAVFAIILFSKPVWALDEIRNLLASRVRFLALASICVFTLWSGVSAFWADARVSVVHHTSAWFLYSLVFLFAILYFNKKRSIVFVVAALGTVSMAVLIICLFNYLSITEFKFFEGTIRVRYAKHAEMLAMTAPFLIAAAMYTRNQTARTVTIIAGAAGWLVVMLSLSKGAFIAGISGFLILFTGVILFSGQKFRRIALTLAVSWIGMTAGVQTLFSFYSSVPATAQYISGKADPERKTSEFRLFTWKIGTSMAMSNPVIGVGADNFGTAFNEARRNYFTDHLDLSDGESVAEDHMVERAHNEPLQIFAELGAVGLILFLLIVAAIVIPLSLRLCTHGRLTPVLVGAAAGMSAFAVSSMVSSFSFRAMQNGVVFMLIFAVAIYELTKHVKAGALSAHAGLPDSLKLAKWLLCSFALASAVFHATTGISNFYVLFGQSEKDPAKSRAYFDTAISFNPENGAAYFLAGTREFIEKRPLEALPLLEKSKEYGATATLNYYYTASSHLLNNEPEKAADALSDAVRIYPRSVYARVHYSVLLEKTGRSDEARNQYSEALRLNNRQAETWRLILTDSLLNATDETRNRRDLDKPYELTPKNIIEAIFFLSKLDKNRE